MHTWRNNDKHNPDKVDYNISPRRMVKRTHDMNTCGSGFELVDKDKENEEIKDYVQLSKAINQVYEVKNFVKE